jgi:hypothetical protein
MMTEEEFFNLYVGCSTEVADQFYPKLKPYGPNPGRGECLRDQGVLYVKLLDRLKEMRVIVLCHRTSLSLCTQS